MGKQFERVGDVVTRHIRRQCDCVCFITKNVQTVCGENTAEYTRYIFAIYTASHHPGTGCHDNGRRKRETYEEYCALYQNRPIVVSLVSVYGGYC